MRGLRRQFRQVLFVVATALALAACQRVRDTADTLRQLQQIQQQVSERVGTHDVAVNLNIGRFLSIGITNSPWEGLPTSEKRQKALEIARLAHAGVGSESRVEVVTVGFAVRRTYFAFINYSRTTDVYQFGLDDLVTGPSKPPLSERWLAKETPQNDLYFVAVGEVPPALLNEMASHFDGTLGARITVLPGLPFDRVTFDPRRAQIVAEELISAIRQRYATLAHNERARVIGITPYDMYIQGLRDQWLFTFSLRSSDDHFAVVSYARMDPARLGRPPDAERLKARLRKMVAKNIGIMHYGLPISPDPRSALYGQIGGVDELDRMTEYFEPE